MQPAGKYFRMKRPIKFYIGPSLLENFPIVRKYPFDRAMHYSAKHVGCPSVCLSVCNVGGSGSDKLEILETNCTDN